MISLLRFRDLEYFIAVAEHGSFSRAAEVCAVGQPTLSGQIRRMEELFGTPLFERGAGPIRLTAAGAEVLPAARTVWQGYERLRRTAVGDGVFLGRALRFGVLPTVAPYFAPQFLSELAAINAGGEITFVESQTVALETAVAADALDFAITATEPEVDGLMAVPLVVEQLSAVSRKALPDAARIEALSGPLLLMQEGHCFREVVRDAIRRAGANAPSTAQIGPASFATLLSLVRAGVGDTVVPTPFVESQSASFEGLSVAPVVPREDGREVRLLVRAGREKYSDVSRLVELARGVLLGRGAGGKALPHTAEAAAAN